ncbi:hypothetical protein [Ferrimonas lipolytica]|uniref:Flagellar protein FliT n=1 Tax=Ferrimonas lipolytica TaxID=2724191 RepID=A0A6H1UDU6_9GAMM|nr:hypothetical protein [Ferrimonas lipolytica]QIZ76799.1 hypothetical protein HER31_07865 [Ferrimonas lipolytica]
MNNLWRRFAVALEQYSECEDWPKLSSVDRKLATVLQQHGAKKPGDDKAYDQMVAAHHRAIERLAQHNQRLQQLMEQERSQRQGLRAYHQTELMNQREHSFYQ